MKKLLRGYTLFLCLGSPAVLEAMKQEASSVVPAQTIQTMQDIVNKADQAQKYIKQDNYDEAYNLYKDAAYGLEFFYKDPKHAKHVESLLGIACFDLGRLCLRKNNLEDAFIWFEKAYTYCSKFYPKALICYLGTYVELLNREGQTFLSFEFLQKCVTYADKCLASTKITGDQRKEVKFARMRATFELSKAWSDLNCNDTTNHFKLKKALDYLQEIIKAYPEEISMLIYIAACNHQVKIWESLGKYHYITARTDRKLDEYDKALKYFNLINQFVPEFQKQASKCVDSYVQKNTTQSTVDQLQAQADFTSLIHTMAEVQDRAEQAKRNTPLLILKKIIFLDESSEQLADDQIIPLLEQVLLLAHNNKKIDAQDIKNKLMHVKLRKASSMLSASASKTDRQEALKLLAAILSDCNDKEIKARALYLRAVNTIETAASKTKIEQSISELESLDSISTEFDSIVQAVRATGKVKLAQLLMYELEQTKDNKEVLVQQIEKCLIEGFLCPDLVMQKECIYIHAQLLSRKTDKQSLEQALTFFTILIKDNYPLKKINKYLGPLYYTLGICELKDQHTDQALAYFATSWKEYNYYLAGEMILQEKVKQSSSSGAITDLLELAQKIVPHSSNPATLEKIIVELSLKQAQLGAQETDNKDVLEKAITVLEKASSAEAIPYLKQAYVNLCMLMYNLNLPVESKRALDICIKALSLDPELIATFKDIFSNLLVRSISSITALKNESQLEALTKIQIIVTKHAHFFETQQRAVLFDMIAKAYVTLLNHFVNDYCLGIISNNSKRQRKSKNNHAVGAIKKIQDLHSSISTYGSAATQAEACCIYSKVLVQAKKYTELHDLLEPLSTTCPQAKEILDRLAYDKEQEKKEKLEEPMVVEQPQKQVLDISASIQTLSLEPITPELDQAQVPASTYKKIRKSKKQRFKEQTAKESVQSGITKDPYAAYDVYFTAGKHHVQEQLEKLKNPCNASTDKTSAALVPGSFEFDSQALYTLGMTWLEGTGGQQNSWSGINYLKKAAALGSAQASFVLGGIYRQIHTVWGLKKDIDVDPQLFGLDPYITKTPLQFIQRTPDYCKWYAARALRSQQVKLGIEHAIDWSLYDYTKMNQEAYANLIKDEKAFHAYTSGAGCAYFEHCIALSGNSNSSSMIQLAQQASFYADNAFSYLYDYVEPQADTSSYDLKPDTMDTADAPTQEILLWLAKHQL